MAGAPGSAIGGTTHGDPCAEPVRTLELCSMGVRWEPRQGPAVLVGVRLAMLVVLLVAACSATPTPTPHEPLYRLATAEEMATWAVDAERAREIAVTLMEPEPDRFLKIEVTPVVKTGMPIWRVCATSLIAGGWDVEIDPRTGRLISARRRPGR